MMPNYLWSHIHNVLLQLLSQNAVEVFASWGQKQTEYNILAILRSPKPNRWGVQKFQVNSKFLYLAQNIEKWVKELLTKLFIWSLILENHLLSALLEVDKLTNRIKYEILILLFEGSFIVQKNPLAGKPVNYFHLLSILILYKREAVSQVVSVYGVR